MPFMIDEEPQFRVRGLDSVVQTWLTDSEETFYNGGAPPNRPLMSIKEVVPKREGPNCYKHRITAEGLMRPGDKIEPAEYVQPVEGWDEYSPTIYTTNPDRYAVGTAHPDHPNLFIECPPSKARVEGSRVWRIQPNYKGIILDGSGLVKAAKWKGTVNGETISTSGLIELAHATPEIFTDEDGVWNGWETGTGRKARFDASRVVLTCTMLSLTPPPTERIGMQRTPEQIAVDIYSIFDEDEWFASGFTFNYPGAAWKLASVQWDQVLDKSVFLSTLSFEYQPLAVPTL